MSPTWAESDSRHETRYLAGDLTIYPARRIVLRNGAEIPLGKLTYDFLLLLVESAPNLVTPEEITETLWADRVVTQDTVRQRAKLLRKALSDDPIEPRYFAVIRGQGYRLIPEVRKLTAESRRRYFIRPRTLAISAFGAMVAGMAIALWPRATTEPTQPVPTDHSIAVLPFEALSNDPDDAFFVDGFHNDLLTQLARIEDLSVISRTSVIEYRDRSKNLREIGGELGVATILEGSIQRSGDKVRINAQLIDAQDDRHLWAAAYDREVTVENLFDIQSEIADAITIALQIELSPDVGDTNREIPTRSSKAYNYYLLGLHHTNGTVRLDAHRNAAQAFEQAVTEDPEFALAWAALGRAHSAIYFFDDHSDERRQRSRAAIERALSLQPDLPEAHLSQGYFLYHTERDYDAALEAWDTAAAGMPGDQRIFSARATVYARMGETDRALDNLERSIELDPRNAHKLVGLAWQLCLAGELFKAESVLQRVLRIAPDDPVGYQRLSFIPLWRNGDGDAMRAVLDSAPMPVRVHPMEWLAVIYERDFDAAITMLDAWDIEAVDTPIVYRPRSWFYGTTHKLAGNDDRAAEYFRVAEADVAALLATRPADLRLKITLADIKGNLGEREAATELARHVLETLPTSLDANLGSNFRLYAVKAFLAAGDYDVAISELDAYLSSLSVWTIEGLLPDPRLDPVREHPQFIELVRRHSQGDIRLVHVR